MALSSAKFYNSMFKKYRQLYIPVNASVLAWFLNCSFNWDNSVTSVEKPIIARDFSLI